jgi:putative aminopeptidase FrvX
MNLFELARELIDIPSVTGDEEDVALFLSTYLDHWGYHVE